MRTIRTAIEKTREQFLLEILENAQRLVVAQSVTLDLGVTRFQEPISNPQNEPFARKCGAMIDDALNDTLLTALMVALGYRIPVGELYALPEYTDLCEFLGNTIEDGNQKWEGG